MITTRLSLKLYRIAGCWMMTLPSYDAEPVSFSVLQIVHFHLLRPAMIANEGRVGPYFPSSINLLLHLVPNITRVPCRVPHQYRWAACYFTDSDVYRLAEIWRTCTINMPQYLCKKLDNFWTKKLSLTFKRTISNVNLSLFLKRY